MSRRVTLLVGSATGVLVAASLAGGAIVLRPDAGPQPAVRPSVTATPHTSPPPSSVRHHASTDKTGSEQVAAPAPGSVTTTAAGSPPVAVADVPKLRHLTAPDVVVSLRHSVTRSQLRRLRHASGVHAVTALDRGRLVVHGPHHHRVPLQVAGVALSDIRGFTPSLTASSSQLWHSVARGELTVGFGSSRPIKHALGKTLSTTTATTSSRATPVGLRVGAFATVGLPQVQALVSHARARQLHLGMGREVLVAAPKISLADLHADVHRDLGARAKVQVTRPVPVDQALISADAMARIPTSYLDLYRRAAVTCPGLPWTVLAGIGTVETGNGANVHRSIAGAEGPMQFLPSTWAMYGVDADGDGKADINDPVDAVFSAARYLCAAGAGRGGHSINQAIFAYNHAWWYVREVLQLANDYT